MRTAPGALLEGRYRLEAEIGRGGMGIVYRARDLPENRDVAVKVIHPEKANALTRGQFLQEAEINARLHHPHIVAVYQTGTVEAVGESMPFLVMELVQGPGLDTLHGLTYASILDIGKQICEALEYAHSQGLVYRDLKPANVLLERRGFRYFVKLTDFGLARPRGLAYLDTESTAAGTLFYLAPELIAGRAADIPSDLYALGATLYEMITGRVPFSDFDERTILSQHLGSPVAPPSQARDDVPPALEAIVLRLLAKQPADRFASARAVREALEQIPPGQGSTAARGNLPPLSTELAGGENEIAQASQLLEENPLVTLAGENKTLVLAVGARLADQFTDGAWWINVEAVIQPAQVLETVASVLGVCQDPGRPLSVCLVQHLREKNLLLLFTGCDRFPGACAQLAETILGTCPDVRILATSEQPLNIPAEKFQRLAA
jgi:serine/threonine protein kinase